MKMKRIGIFLVLAAGMVLTGCVSFLSFFLGIDIVPSNIKSGVSEVVSAVYSKDGRFLFLGVSPNIESLIAKYDAGTGKLVKKFLKVENNGYPNLLPSEDGRSLLVWYNSSEDNPDPCIYDVESGKILHTISNRGGYFAGSDGFRTMNATRLQSGGITIKIADTVTGAITREITVPDFAHLLLKRWGWHYISRDGRFYDYLGYAHEKSNEIFWIIHHVDLEDTDLATSYIHSDLDYLETFHSIAYSPDRKYMAVRFTQSIFPQAEYAERLEQAQIAVSRVNRYADNYEYLVADALGRYGFSLNTRGDKWTYQWKAKEGVRVYNLDSADVVLELVGEALVDRIDPLAFGPDGKSLYAGYRIGALGSNGKWQFNSWRSVSQSGERFFCFTPDGKQMVVKNGSEGIAFIDLK
jgi:WD40 repeat protein